MALPPLDKSQVLIKPPFAGIVANAKLHEPDRVLGVDVRQEDRAEAIRGEIARVELHREVQHRFEQVQLTDVESLIRGALSLQLPAEIEQDAYPVNVGHQ